MNIYYLCPDVNFPSGGVKRLFEHVEILRQSGFTSFILHFKKGFKVNWFKSDVPVLYLDDNPPLSPNDIIVFPEGFSNIIKKFQNLPFKKVVIALSHNYIFQNIPSGENWSNYGVDAVITPSKTIKEFICWSMGIKNIFIIGTSIDHELFNYDNKVKILKVSYISRKDTCTSLIEKIIKSKDPYFKNIKFEKIENLTLDNYASVLKNSHIFITTSPHEGINRSVLEAMACGCICLGFHGIGAKDYICEEGADQNFILAENMNYIELAQLLADTIKRVDRNDSLIEKIRKNALITASKFNPLVERESIIKFWTTFIEKSK